MISNRNSIWYTMDKRVIALILVISVAVPLFSGCIGEVDSNEKPLVSIAYPLDGTTVSNIVMISGEASDPDGDDALVYIEVKINDEWNIADGTTKWSYEWRAYEIDDGLHTVHVRAWDGTDHSEVEEITVRVDNPQNVESDAHRWAIFIGVANFPADNESKLGNGGLIFAEEAANYLIEECGYSTSNIIILFDDGWIREDNGYGDRIQTLQQRSHDFDIIYGGATKGNVLAAIDYIADQSNKYDDSEIFIWMFGHGCGDSDDELTGGKILESSSVFLWDDTLDDQELGGALADLKSKETCVIIDACFSAGFVDKTIYNFPEFFLLKSGIPKSGRVVMTGASKFREGFASTTHGPLFSLLWFEGITTGKADGFKPGILKRGKPSRLNLFKDGKVSVEEAFYYASYVLRTDKAFEDYDTMEPQINDQYSHRGILRSKDGLFLGE